ncbi:PP2C family protein-serine/threonine phosphatase [Streptomyces sp. 4N509B]|uniref:PP2C family protein-serine/threonine phosphatase n=1 Tax=Streptomyces sp. 4N509B TaxID=3457413 RepID=UPI003FD19191
MARTSQTDYAALFAVLPRPTIVLSPDLEIIDANHSYLELTGRERGDLVGRQVFEAFPGNPGEPDGGEGPAAVAGMLKRASDTRALQVLEVQRYDVQVSAQPLTFEERWWSVYVTPVDGPDGELAWLLVQVDDVTDAVRSLPESPEGTAERRASPRTAAGLYAQAAELRRLNAELRRVTGRQRQVALRLQESMLHSPDLPRHPNAAVRYLPSASSLHVCGDWYDVTDVNPARYAVAVGDVVGNGLEAAAVMGMLRSALSALMRAEVGPGRALAVLGLYAGSVEGGTSATAVKLLIDTDSHELIYSSAGHPPPLLLHPDDRVEVLDQATDPPLATWPEEASRVEASLPYQRGDTLVLYTDGLIERRGEDIDVGLGRLVDALTGGGEVEPEELADALLERLGVVGGAADDIALLVIRL